MYRLQDLFTDYESLSDSDKEKNYFRVRLQIYKIDPVDIRDCCVALCTDSLETISCENLPPNGKASCNQKPTQLVWQIQFLVKD